MSPPLPSAHDWLTRMLFHVSPCTRRTFTVSPAGEVVETDYRFVGLYGDLDLDGHEVDNETIRGWMENWRQRA